MHDVETRVCGAEHPKVALREATWTTLKQSSHGHGGSRPLKVLHAVGVAEAEASYVAGFPGPSCPPGPTRPAGLGRKG